ncbi:MAG: riboflavin synthase [Alphaproteobacteria bacterium]|nr:riboflavin synthase [Alphaproteobacteria bacterium]
MFTGIVTDVGRVASATDRGDRRFVLATGFDTGRIDIGASISCSGCCLTVVEKGPGRFAVDASGETLSVTTLGDWQEGTEVNLERALRLGDELGGHLVSGHVDGVGRVVSVREEGASHRILFEAPAELSRFIASKGSIAVDGASLTVNEVDGRRFGANIIPYTWTRTTFRRLVAGSRVNLEIDLLARYVARLMEPETSR